MTYTDLLARLEAATEGSRELDGLIAAATKTGARRLYKLAEGCHYEYEASEDIGKVNVFSVGPTLRHLEQIYDAPHFTESLDAALTLVPEGWFWEIALGVPANTRSKIGAGPYWATLSPMDEKLIEKMREAKLLSHEGDIMSGAPTAALAACKAILRARQSLEEQI